MSYHLKLNYLVGPLQSCPPSSSSSPPLMAQPQDRPHTSSFWSGIFFRTIYASWKQNQNWISILFCQLFAALSIREGSNIQSFQFLTAKPKSRPWPSAPFCFQRWLRVSPTSDCWRILTNDPKSRPWPSPPLVFSHKILRSFIADQQSGDSESNQIFLSTKLIKWLRHVYHNTLPPYSVKTVTTARDWLT